MRISEWLYYIGPNRRLPCTAIEWHCEFRETDLEALLQARAGGFARLQSMLESLGFAADPVRDLLEPAIRAENAADALAGLLAHLALVLQRSGGHDVGASVVVAGTEPSQRRVVFEFEYSGVGETAGDLALRIIAEGLTGVRLESGSDESGLSARDNFAGRSDQQPADAAQTGIQQQSGSDVPGSAESAPGHGAGQQPPDAGPALSDSSAQAGTMPLAEAVPQFREEAAGHVLPADTAAIIRAAERLDVPWVKLERDPYGTVEGDFRIRRNGLLKLGHACYQHILDGTLCIDRNAALVPLLFDREAAYLRMHRLGLPVPRQDLDNRQLMMTRKILRAAGRVGYPVVLKLARRHPADRRPSGPSPARALHDAAALQQAMEPLRAAGQRIVVEQFIAGETWHLLLANHQLVALFDAARTPLPLATAHPAVLEMAQAASRSLDSGLLLMDLVTPDIARSLEDSGGAVTGIDPAPRLDHWFEPASQLLDQAAEGLVRWLYPPGAPARIPLVAVTGTNGKTTTSTMLRRMWQRAGLVPGMASTIGVFVGEQRVAEGDQAGTGGHHLVFESAVVNAGVLETARGGIAHSGFMFDACDVGVCLNVSPDHIGDYGINTLQDMVRLKRSIVERARAAVVLNADYATCLAMLPLQAGVQLYLASLSQAPGTLLGSDHQPDCVCTVEMVAGCEWIVLYARAGERVPVIATATIPATFDGAARMNVSNAQHAICAAHALGIPLGCMQDALAAFEADFSTTPGRLNVRRDLPFTVVMDYVHNIDGMARMAEFLDSMPVSGRRIVMFAAPGDRLDAEVADYTRSAVGRFDHYVCRNHPSLRGRQPGEIPRLMRRVLLAAGVPDERITVEPDPALATRHTLQMARPGDLVLLATAEIEAMWEEVLSFCYEDVSDPLSP